MEATRSPRLRSAASLVALPLVAVSTGCVGLLAQMGYWSGGGNVPPAYAGLEGQRVAVVCVSESPSLGSGGDAVLLAREVGTILRRRVKNITVVSPEEVADWTDRNDWNEVDFVEVGRGVKAEKVVAVDLSGFGLYEGKTLYRGRANLTVRVFDLTDGGKEVFRRNLPEQSFPANGAYPATDTSEARFRMAFLKVLAKRVAKFFYEYEQKEDFSPDPPFLG